MDPKYAKRLTFGSLMFFGLLGGLWAEGYYAARNIEPSFNGIILTGVIIIVSICSTLEFRKLAAGRGITVFAGTVIPPMVILILSQFHRLNSHENFFVMLLIMLTFFTVALRQAFKYGSAGAISNISASMFAFIYLGLGGYFLTALRLMEWDVGELAKQSGYILTFLATVKGTDIGAYLIGRKLGKHKIVPSISPGKSWEGLVGGFIFSSAIAVMTGTWAFGLITPIQAIIFGVVLTVYGQFGDLIESMFKRDAGLKDSASMIPEFGGFLDLIDSPYFAAPLGWVLFTVMKHGFNGLIF